jgi:hypothetical protein
MRASVRVYCQGLGDCILVRVILKSGDDFKLLIDCGVVLGTEDASSIMTRVVENVVENTKEKNDDAKGKIDVLAITHEHWDHLSAFNQAAASFAKLGVDSVWVAWTEDPDDDLAKQLKSELGKAEERLAACVTAFHATGDGATVDMLADIALTAFGAAASSSVSTKAAFDKAKAMAKVTICWPTGDPFEIPDANARLYVIGPPHDPKLIRKINPSTSSPETHGIAMNGAGALPLGVISALDNRKAAIDQTSPLARDSKAPFHPRVTIPLGPKGRPWSFDDGRSVDEDDWKRIDNFLREHYHGGDDWRRIDGDWLGPATELALALQSYTNNTSLVLALELGDVGKGDVLPVCGRRAGRQLGVLADLAVGEGREQGHGTGSFEANDLLQGRTPRQPQRHPDGTRRRPDGCAEDRDHSSRREGSAEEALGPDAAPQPHRGAREKGTGKGPSDGSEAGQSPRERRDRRQLF